MATLAANPTAVSAGPVARKPSSKIVGQGIVVEVGSGDQVVLMGYAPKGQIPKQMVITFSGIEAPRLGRRKGEKDEPFAWAAREYVRTKTIGTKVNFLVNHQDSKSGRCYGKLTLLSGENLTHSLVSMGLAKLKEGSKRNDGKMHPDREDIFNLQESAKARQVGMWNPNVNEEDQIRHVDYKPSARALFAKFKGVPLPAIVDRVLDGTTMRVELLSQDGSLSHKQIMLYTAGAVSPRTPLPMGYRMKQYQAAIAANPDDKTIKPPQEIKALPYALEAQHFVSTRLLHRQVKVVLQGIDAFDNFFGSIAFHKGNMTAKLLEYGLATFVPWSAAITGDAATLQRAEMAAKKAHLRLHKDWVEAAEPLSPFQDYTAKVTGVSSGDALQVQDAEGVTKRVYLASIRTPRMSTRGRAEEPCAMEAREYLRKRVIGKKVRVVRQYVRTDKEGTSRDMVSVYQGKHNMALGLVNAGLAQCLRHRREEPRSSEYEALLLAEDAAKQAQKGVHNKAKASTAKRIVDLTMRKRRPAPKKEVEADKANDGDDNANAKDGEEKKEDGEGGHVASAAKSYLAFLQAKKTTNAVVEYVFSASRLKLYVEKENCLISFVLAGIRTPMTKNKETGEVDPLGVAANEFVRDNFQQHDVKIETETCDRGDNFIGTVWANKQNLSVVLLERGLATVYGFSADRSTYKEDLYAAEEKAKAARLGVWKDWDPEKAAAEAKAAADARAAARAEAGEEVDADALLAQAKENSFLNVTITDMSDAVSFFVQVVGNPDIEKVSSFMSTYTPEEVMPEDWEPERGVVHAGRFNESEWHRVQVAGHNPEGGFRVTWLDFGNQDVLDKADIRPLGNDGVAKIRGLAKPCVLAGLKAPGAGGAYFEDSLHAFSDLAWDQNLLAKVECVDDDNKMHLTLHQSDAATSSINQQLLRSGLVRIHSRPNRKLRDYAKGLAKDQEHAKNKRLGQWEYGDVSSDDEEEATGRKRDDGRPPRKF